MKGTDEVHTFRLGELTFGLEAELLREVLRSQPMTPVPLAAPMVAGLINLRGQIVTVLDLRMVFGLGSRPTAASPLHLIVKSSDGLVSLIVDDVGGVVELDHARVERPPSSPRGPFEEFVRGVFTHETGQIHLLDLPSAVAVVRVGDDGVAA